AQLDRDDGLVVNLFLVRLGQRIDLVRRRCCRVVLGRQTQVHLPFLGRGRIERGQEEEQKLKRHVEEWGDRNNDFWGLFGRPSDHGNPFFESGQRSAFSDQPDRCICLFWLIAEG